MHQSKTGILLSGGMDSIAIAYWKRPSYAFTIDYGQKPAEGEIHAAQQVTKFLRIQHHVIRVDCTALGSGDMSTNDPLPFAPVKEWWPFRNQLLVTLACMKGIGLGLKELYVGSVVTDIAHLDGTKEFYSHLSKLIEYQEGNIVISSPASELSTVDLVKKSGIPISLLLWAHSCHTSNSPCMTCNGCQKYLMTLQELGVEQ